MIELSQSKKVFYHNLIIIMTFKCKGRGGSENQVGKDSTADRAMQTWHSIEMKNQGYDQQKIKSWGKKSGLRSNRLQKEIIHTKRRPFMIRSFFLPISHKECFELSDQLIYVLFMSFLSVCVCVLFPCLFPQTSL